MCVSQEIENIEISDEHVWLRIELFDPCDIGMGYFLSYQEGDCGVCQTFGVCPNFDIVAENCKVNVSASLRGSDLPTYDHALAQLSGFVVQQRWVCGAPEEERSPGMHLAINTVFCTGCGIVRSCFPKLINLWLLMQSCSETSQRNTCVQGRSQLSDGTL
ncbi:mitochondrial inner membrane protease subunit 1 isoform X3 [Chiroxiphia lanceolata]|uniref:mitochondrial inner membrane protease subunit 1 isoform X3 n=1 Tax=Chiroxiphia lanceolata TaxID=296741 RepID=UPI0013CE6A05|nr:mitochondrial inner membrane protease subunit 1 isoform X3 [Chiroxiphia lanceolata]